MARLCSMQQKEVFGLMIRGVARGSGTGEYVAVNMSLRMAA